MFGSSYAHYPEILTDSFDKMNDKYAGRANFIAKESFLNKILGMYISLFGIPEIGFQVRFFHFAKALSYIKKAPKHILDAGTGIGAYAFYLRQRYPHAIIDGVDIDRKKIKFCKEYIKNKKIRDVKFAYQNIAANTLGGNRYDLIVNVDVLEHIKNYRHVLKNFSKSLNVGGYLFIHTPYVHQKRMFRSLKSWHHEDHIREGFTKKDLTKELEMQNLEIILAYHSFGSINRFTWEIDHMLLAKSIVLAGIFYPILSLGVFLDILFADDKGWGLVVLAKKIKK